MFWRNLLPLVVPWRCRLFPPKCLYIPTKLHSIASDNSACVSETTLSHKIIQICCAFVGSSFLDFGIFLALKHKLMGRLFESCSSSLLSALYKSCLWNVPQNAWLCIDIQITKFGLLHKWTKKLCYTVLLCVMLMWYDLMIKLKVVLLL
jgi:hypothetical protein